MERRVEGVERTEEQRDEERGRRGGLFCQRASTRNQD